MEAELDSSQVKVVQAHGVLQAVKREVKRWQLEGAIMDIKHQQVGWDAGHVRSCSTRCVLPRGSKVCQSLQSGPIQISSPIWLVGNTPPTRVALLEHVRWSNVTSCTQVLGEVLLSAGYLAYLGPLPGSYRKQV